MGSRETQHWIGLTLMVLIGVASVLWDLPPGAAAPAVAGAAQCSQAEECPAVPNSWEVRCIRATCSAVCNAGFKASGLLCVSGEWSRSSSNNGSSSSSTVLLEKGCLCLEQP
jgi:hypothetical protein